MSPSWLAVREHGVELRVRVVPGATREGVAGLYGDRLKIRVTGQAVGNAANECLVRLIARVAKVPPSKVRIVLGERGRSKLVFVDAPDGPRAVAERICLAWAKPAN
jgi:uncharacterized protein YggU (UPF0235/DUF167 family)